VRYGRPAAEALREEIVAAKGDEPLAPVTVVVPSNHVGVAARRLLASGRLGPTTAAERGVGLVAVTFVTTYRLAELLGAPVLAGQGRRPVSTPVITAAVRRALQQEPGMFAPVAAHPATELALGSTYRELRDLDEAALDRLVATGRRGRDVVRIHRAARTFLAGGWYDEEDLIEAAIGTIATRPPAELGTVIVHLPQRLSRHGGVLLRALADAGSLSVVAGTTGIERADREVVTSVRRLDDPTTAVTLFESGPGEDPSIVEASVDARRTTVLTASDADEEVREAVRDVVAAVRSGTPLDRIAVLHASAQPYDRLVREHLEMAGIRTNGAATIATSERVAGRTLLQLLELPELDYRRDDVFAWLGAAPVLDQGRWAPVASWERASREAGVVGGRAEWDSLLGVLVDRWRAEADTIEADPDEPDARAERLRSNAERAASLRRFVLRLIDDLAAERSSLRSWSDRADWARGHLRELLGDAGERARWPALEQRGYERVELALDRLVALDDVEGPVSLDVFTRTLQSELEVDLGRVGRFGEGVLVGSVTMGVGLDLDLVIVLGLAEGSFPASVRDDSLVPDAEREVAGPDLPRRVDRIERQHRELLAAVAGADRQLLTIPRGDLRQSRDRVASRWLLDIAEILGGRRLWTADLWKAQDPWIRHRASFDAGLRAPSFPATGQEHRLRRILAEAGGRGTLHELADRVDPMMAAGVQVLDARRSGAFTRFDGDLRGVAIPSPIDRGASATSLESWVTCPFAYFMQRLLGIDAVERPEDELDLTPLDKGSLIHEVLERFVLDAIADPGATPYETFGRWTDEARARLDRIGNDICDAYERSGRTGRPFFWVRQRQHILDALQRFALEDDQFRRWKRMWPVAAELSFGLRDGGPSVMFPLPDGREIPFRGKADRVDVAEDGTIVVLDYKTGSRSKYAKLSADDPDLGGTLLQLPVYGEAARAHLGRPDAPVEAYYWFVAADDELTPVGYAVTGDVVDHVGETMQRIVEGIEAGVFVAHPERTQTWYRRRCPYCDPDNLGTVELRRQFERKTSDPALLDYVELSEPDLVS
jgi:RecB family exonuclease